MEINFLDSSNDKIWILYPYLCFTKKNCTFLIEEEVNTIKEITSITSDICKRVEEDFNVSVYFSKNNWSGHVILCCSIMRLLNFEPLKAITYIKSCFLSGNVSWKPKKEPDIWLINKYRPPLKVLICGDRNSATCFEDLITFELKNLPQDSTIVHGGCRGVDLYAAELARLAGFRTKSFPIYPEEWETVGLSAGPKRNSRMLEEKIDFVLAFHPDIEHSKGTRDMMQQAFLSKIPVYIHDLKRKSKFEGDFSVL